MTYLTEGGFVVVWQSLLQDGDSYGIYGQRYSSTGQPVAFEFQVNTYTTAFQDFPMVTALTEGGFVVVWNSWGQDSNDYGVYGRIFLPIESPILLNNKLTIEEGETVLLTSTLLSAMDPDSNNATLIFTVNNVQQGYFERTSNIGVAITSFIQQEITDNQIRFVHDGSENAPTYDVKVSDGSLETGYTAVNITFTNINDTPQLLNNKLTIDEGETLNLTSTMLSAMDVDSNNATLKFTVNNVQYGYFENRSNIGVAITSFIQQEITDNQIRFVHDGSDNAPSYAVKVSDGSLDTTYAAAQIVFTNINDNIPQLVNNQLIIEEGGTVVLTSSMLSATDVDNDDTTLNFTVKNVQQGRFERVSNPGITVTSFIQQEIIDVVIQFVHDDGEIAPSYEVKVSDGTLETSYASASIMFTNINDVPVLGNNQLTLNEGQTVLLTNSMLSATDVDNNDTTLNFTVKNVQQGRFERVSNPGVAITSFIQQEIMDAAIQFVHDGSNNVPSYLVKVSDGALETTLTSALINFTPVNDIPMILNNQLTLTQGKTVIITSNMLSAMDEETDNTTLTFTINALQQGKFVNIGTPNRDIVTFKQQEIIDGKIRFVANGAPTSPSYEVKVSDGILESAFMPANVTFQFQNNFLTIFLISGSIAGGACLCLTASAIVLISTAGIWMAKRKQGKNAKNTVEVIRAQKIELEESSEITKEQVSLDKKIPTVTATEKGFFQPPKMTAEDVIELQLAKQKISSSKEYKKQTETSNIVELRKVQLQSKSVQKNKPIDASTSEDESEGDELNFVTSEEVTLKSCDNLAESKTILSAWKEKYSASNDVLLVYQKDVKGWFICGKNSEECVINEKLSTLSKIGGILQSKSLEEIAKIDSEELLDTALDYLGYEDDSATEDSSEDSSTDAGLLRVNP